jgi:hypothetical protein
MASPQGFSARCCRSIAKACRLWNKSDDKNIGEIVTVGLDIAKSVFQVHGVDCDGNVVEIRRTPAMNERMARPVCKWDFGIF